MEKWLASLKVTTQSTLNDGWEVRAKQKKNHELVGCTRNPTKTKRQQKNFASLQRRGNAKRGDEKLSTRKFSAELSGTIECGGRIEAKMS